MSVYTPLEFDEVAAFIARYDGLQLKLLESTTAGIENSNFFLDATDRQGQRHAFVLTVFESVPEHDLPYFAALLAHLQQAGLPVPAPLRDKQGQPLQRIKNKACMLVPRLSGGHIQTPSPAQCAAIASALARIHLTTGDFTQHRRGAFGAAWREASCALVTPSLDAGELDLLREQLARWQAREQQSPLPGGVTHGDLFHDNALFEGDRLTGIIDFYYACDDVFVYDLAILVNDWCNEEDGALDPARYAAVLAGYQQIRMLSEEERQALPDYLAFAALRFWLSRLVNACDPAKVGVKQKSPQAMQNLLRKRLAALP